MSKSSVQFVYTFPSLKFDEIVSIKSEDEVVKEELDEEEEDPLALTDTKFINKPAFIQAHEDRKEAIKYRKYGCKYDKCDRQFERKHSLDLHIIQEHSSITPKWYCFKCDFQTTKKNTLKSHISQVHGGILYACNQCMFQAAIKQQLKKHIKAVHQGIKYACNQCGSEFTAQGSLKIHVQSQHLGIKKHSCPECGKTFTRKHSLKYHLVRYHVKQFLW